ncbi:GNAT family N-acetyltransferase [Pseudomonas sp. ICMP 561]|uniref:GNAT family N-acetyltransferase n=1 Tax=Pseudomonas sp. ICMP 561 TaxID=1718918 RepID=UPI000C077164|nr:GNAT family N-acetyltransferase [Pseudomonas sp. ICMP 561]PHN28594.1 GNAT family acetyltransferase [Pseudomonas sp. ICMP 561]
MPMRAPSSAIVVERFTEAHAESVTALYNVPAVARQVLQMPYQSADIWRKRLDSSNERLISLVALHEGTVVGQGSLEQFSRIRRSHCGSIGMAVAQDWQGQGIGKQLLTALLEVADNWMKLRRVELMVYSDNQAAVILYEKLGFETEGLLRDYAVRDGQFTDALTMARIRA